MPEYRRASTKGGTYFFTVNTYRRQPVLIDEDVRDALREGIDKTREVMPFQILAWVLLPDHLHCIWMLPEGDADFAKRWGMIKRHVSQCCGDRLNHEEWLSESRRKRNETSLWQRRYWEHQIRDEADFARHVDYIHWNPCEARSGGEGGGVAIFNISPVFSERGLFAELVRGFQWCVE